MFWHKKTKKGIDFKIPGFGDRHIQALLADYDGTLSRCNQVSDEIKDSLVQLSEIIDVHILTGDRNVKARDCLGNLPVNIHILSEKNQDVQKRDYLQDFHPGEVVVFGNGNNDRLLLEAVKTAGGLCIVVDNGEGCAVEALINSHMLVRSSTEALNLLLDPQRCATTLRY
jgi:soluble P-type ATPase